MNKIIVSVLTAAAIAVASFFTGATTDAGQAVQVAMDKDKALVECGKLLNAE